MAFTSHSGPVRVGPVKSGAGRNTGLVVLSQEFDSGDLTGTAVGNVDTAAMILPQGARVIDVVVDQVVAAAGGTTTVSVGTTSGGAEVMPAVATTAGGQFRGTLTAASQLARSLSTAADTTLYVRNAVGTGALTAGRFIVTVTYVQRAPNGATNPATV